MENIKIRFPPLEERPPVEVTMAQDRAVHYYTLMIQAQKEFNLGLVFEYQTFLGREMLKLTEAQAEQVRKRISEGDLGRSWAN